MSNFTKEQIEAGAKFHTSYYKENWNALMRRAIEKVDNDPIK